MSHDDDQSVQSLVGLPEVAEVLGVHRATVNDMVRCKRLRAERRGAHWMVKKSDLDEFASSYVRPPNAPNRRSSALPPAAAAILAFISDFGAASAGELAPLLELHEGNVRKHLRLMEVAGLVMRQADGQWHLTDKAEGTQSVSSASVG